MTLDLSDLPPLIEPHAPTNTLLITNLDDPSIFRPATLDTIRRLLATHAPLHSFAPLKSLRRIVVSFADAPAATHVRQLLDGAAIVGRARARVYFGEPTPIAHVGDRHLAAPQSGRLFFISPPPSPPHGWTVRDEAPPNKEVHADDLAAALEKLHARSRHGDEVEREDGAKEGGRVAVPDRRRSSVVVYHPDDHGSNPALPAVMVEDMTEGDEEMKDEGTIMAHTARPPVELMDCS